GGAASELHESIGTGLEQHGSESLARAFKRNVNRTALLLGLGGLDAVGAAACWFDFLLVQNITFDYGSNPIDGGTSEEMYWPLMARTAVTVVLYTLASICWHWRWRVAAVLVYGFVSGVLAVQIWPTLDESLWWGWRAGLLAL